MIHQNTFCRSEERLTHADTSRVALLLVSLTRPFAYYESLSHPDSILGVFKNLAVAVSVHGEKDTFGSVPVRVSKHVATMAWWTRLEAGLTLCISLSGLIMLTADHCNA
jgi:hypothetical protein